MENNTQQQQQEQQQANQEQSTGGATPPKDELQVMREQLTGLEQQLKEANARLSDPNYIEYLAQKAMGGSPKEPIQGPSGSAPAEPELPEDFDELTPKQFLEMVKGVVANEVLPQIGQVAAGVSKLEARMEIERVAQKYEDFSDYVPIMQELVQANPYLHPEQAYLLAKNMAKAKPATTQAGEPAPVVPLAKKIAEELRGSGALPDGVMPNKERTRGKTVSQVAGSVYDKLFGGK